MTPDEFLKRCAEALDDRPKSIIIISPGEVCNIISWTTGCFVNVEEQTLIFDALKELSRDERYVIIDTWKEDI